MVSPVCFYHNRIFRLNRAALQNYENAINMAITTPTILSFGFFKFFTPFCNKRTRVNGLILE